MAAETRSSTITVKVHRKVLDYETDMVGKLLARNKEQNVLEAKEQVALEWVYTLLLYMKDQP